MLLSHMERLVDANSVAGIRDSYFDALRGHGYSCAFYGASFQSDLPPAVIREDPEIHSNFPGDFIEEMRRYHPFGTSPWMVWANSHAGSIPLAQLVSESRHDPGMVRALEIASRHGAASLRIISLKGRVARARGLVAICPALMARPAEEAALWLKNHREIATLTAIMHMRMATICRHPQRSGLTPRQREVLEWTSAGKTVAEVATILGLTPATVEKHLRLARDALDAGSTAQAILKAHVTNQIFLQKTA